MGCSFCFAWAVLLSCCREVPFQLGGVLSVWNIRAICPPTQANACRSPNTTPCTQTCIPQPNPARPQVEGLATNLPAGSKNLLTFSEPNHRGEGNISPEDAAVSGRLGGLSMGMGGEAAGLCAHTPSRPIHT